MTRVLGHVAAEQTAQRHDREEDHGSHSDEELHDTEDLGDHGGLADAKDVDGGPNVDDENDDEEQEALRQMLSSGPSTRDVHPFGARGEDHDERGDRTTQTDGGPDGGLVGGVVPLLPVVLCVQRLRIECHEKPEHGDVENPDAVEVDEQVEPRSGLLVRLEEGLLPCDVLQFQVALCGWDVHDARLVFEDDALDAFGIPEELVHVVVADDLGVVLFPAHVLAVDNFKALIAEILIDGGDGAVEEGELLDRLDLALALGRHHVVVCALEDEAKTFWHEAHLIGLAPAEEVEGDLPNTVLLRHAVHARLPAELGSLQAIVAFQALQSLCLVLGVLIGFLLRGLASLARFPIGLAQLHVGEANRVVKIQMRGKVPSTIVRVFATNVVSMEREQGLVGRHAGGPGVELRH